MKLAAFILSLGLAAAMGASIDLAWSPSTTKNVVGYNVYYGTASHSYQNQLPVGTNTIAHVDGLEAGVTYFFAVTAVDVFGVESDYSNEFSEQAPLSPTTNIVTLSVPVISATNLNGPWSTDEVVTVSYTNPPGQKFFRFGMAMTQTNQTTSN